MRQLNQSGLITPEQMDRWSIGIIGTGAIGSFTAMALTKMGFKNIATWDDDTIEDHNIANQMFPVGDVGKKKAIATREMVKQFSGENIVSLSIRATAKKVYNFLRSTFPGTNTMILLCVDSLDVRKAIAEELAKEYGIFVLDARMGAKTYRVLGFDSADADSIEAYMKTFVADKDAVQERCGQKSIIYTVLGVAAELCSFVHKTITPNNMGGHNMPPEVIFDYGAGIRIQRRIITDLVKLDDLPDTPEAEAAPESANAEQTAEVPF